MGVRGKNIPVTLDEETWRILKKLCRLRGEPMSVFIRRAVRKEMARLGALDDETKQALELVKTQT